MASSNKVAATFHVYLPQVADQVDVPQEDTLGRERGNGDETILLVEDDEGVRELAREVLQARGYAVMAAATPREAIEICAREEGPIDLLITDAVMPGMSGKEMATKLAEVRPEKFGRT